MTPKEKAKELVSKYINLYPSYIVMFQGDIDKAQLDIKQCALIAVEELIYETQFEVPNIRQRYWIDVKQEIKNI
jgi:hypothetical protein